MCAQLINIISGNPVANRMIEGVVTKSSFRRIGKCNTTFLSVDECPQFVISNFSGIIPVGRKIRLYIPSTELDPVALEILDNNGRNIIYDAILSESYTFKNE